jgi:hypothetical protein
MEQKNIGLWEMALELTSKLMQKDQVGRTRGRTL